jgi:hypothetical protein
LPLLAKVSPKHPSTGWDRKNMTKCKKNMRVDTFWMACVSKFQVVLLQHVATNFRKNPGSKQHPADCPSGLGGSRTWKFQVPAAVRVGVPGDPDKLVVLYTVYTQADRKMERWMAGWLEGGWLDKQMD